VADAPYGPAGVAIEQARCADAVQVLNGSRRSLSLNVADLRVASVPIDLGVPDAATRA